MMDNQGQNYKISRSSTSGFSLVEMLTVVAVMAVLLSVSVIGFSHVTRSNELTMAGNQVLDELVAARQRAIADSAHVELRFYRPEDDFESGNDLQWTVLQVRELPDKTFRALERPLFLPRRIIFMESGTHSTLIDSLTKQVDSDRVFKGHSLNDEEAKEYTAFRFNSNGSTDLPTDASGDTWHLTIVDQNSVQSASELPDNFYTVAIDPDTGTTKTFRP